MDANDIWLEVFAKKVVLTVMDLSNVELELIDGSKTTFGKVAGKVTLVVNVASRCGLTPQYEALEALQKKYGPKGLVVLGLPSNQFFQELSSEDDISSYCSTTWGVTFPMTSRVKVNGRSRHALYKELVKTKDGAGLAGPVLWNFEKFLVTKNGIKRFRPPVKPDDAEIITAIEAAL